MRAILAAVISIAVSFTAVISLGFWIRGQTSAVSDTAFGTVAGLAIAAIACVIFFAILGIKPWKRTKRQTYNIVPWEVPAGDITCPHLRPIEQAMRQAGFRIQILGGPEYGPVFLAECRINEPELIRVFNLPPSIYYQEGFEPERSQWDNPRADIYCAECLPFGRGHSGIRVLHPLESPASTPWFPSAPLTSPPM